MLDSVAHFCDRHFAPDAALHAREALHDAPVDEQVADAAPVELDDVEVWVAAVFDYQNNGGPKPVRRTAQSEA